MRRHGWHVMDAETGMEVRRTVLGWQVRTADGKKRRLTKRQFEQLRAAGPNPKGL